MIHEEGAAGQVVQLQSLDQPEVVLSIAGPETLGISYDFTLSDAEVDTLRLTRPEDVVVAVVIRRAGDEGKGLRRPGCVPTSSPRWSSTPLRASACRKSSASSAATSPCAPEARGGGSSRTSTAAGRRPSSRAQPGCRRAPTPLRCRGCSSPGLGRLSGFGQRLAERLPARRKLASRATASRNRSAAVAGSPAFMSSIPIAWREQRAVAWSVDHAQQILQNGHRPFLAASGRRCLRSVAAFKRLQSVAIGRAPVAPAHPATAHEERTMTRSVIATANAPAAIGTYSQAVKAGNTVHVSGQIGLDPASMQMVEGFDAQTEQVFRNLRRSAKLPAARLATRSSSPSISPTSATSPRSTRSWPAISLSLIRPAPQWASRSCPRVRWSRPTPSWCWAESGSGASRQACLPAPEKRPRSACHRRLAAGRASAAACRTPRQARHPRPGRPAAAPAAAL